MGEVRPHHLTVKVSTRHPLSHLLLVEMSARSRHVTRQPHSLELQQPRAPRCPAADVTKTQRSLVPRHV